MVRMHILGELVMARSDDLVLRGAPIFCRHVAALVLVELREFEIAPHFFGHRLPMWCDLALCRLLAALVPLDDALDLGDRDRFAGLGALLLDGGGADDGFEGAACEAAGVGDRVLEFFFRERAEHASVMREILVDALRLQSGFFDNPLSTVLAAAALGEPDRFLLCPA